MAHPSKRKGDHYEREIAHQLAELTGWPIERKLGAGRREDTGDLYGIPDCCAQVKAYPSDPQRAIRETLAELPRQWANSGCTHAVGFVRRPGGIWVAVQNLDMWATSHREATSPIEGVA